LFFLKIHNYITMKSQAVLNVKPKIHFQFVDGLRGLVALWVVLRHSAPDKYIPQFANALPQWLVDIVFKWGGNGVPIFFVLSGFVIAHSVKNAKMDFSYFKNFSLRRFVRLSPVYYVSIFITLCISFMAAYVQNEQFEPMGEPLSFPRLIAHFFYVQDIFNLTHIDDVYWTLCLEIQFYLVFCFLVALAQSLDIYWQKNWGKLVIFIPSAVIGILYPLQILKYDGRATIFLPLWYSFILGIFAYWTWRKDLNSWFFYCYATVLLSVGIVYTSGFAITSSIIAMLLLEVARTNRMQDLLNWQWLQFIGKISFSLYLTHVPIMGGVYFLGNKIINHSIWSEFILLLVIIGICISFATFIWHFVEKPSIQWSKKLKAKEIRNTISVSN